MKKIKEDKKLFNLNLPITLIKYIERQATSRYTTMAQYIIDLLMKDKENKEKT